VDDELLFSGYSILDSQDEKNFGYWLHNNVSILDNSETNTEEWLNSKLCIF
jgi:hypothetical protein